MKWYHFWDMNSGGSVKLNWEHIFIKAESREQAISVFYARFHRNPQRVTCTCCGPDYAISESESLALATAYERNCAYKGDSYVDEPHLDPVKGERYVPLEAYLDNPQIKVIHSSEIKPEETTIDVPQEGCIWA